MNEDEDIGVTIPGPNLKPKIDKTAAFIAKQGVSTEQKLLIRNPNGFEFLKSEHPFHAYYVQQREKLALEIHKKTLSSGKEGVKEISSNKAELKPTLAKVAKKIEEQKKELEELSFILRHPNLNDITTEVTQQNLEIIKLTAQYAALRGSSFLNKITEQERHNKDFAFLGPTKLNPYFLKLIESYQEIVSTDKKVLSYVENSFSNKFDILERAVRRGKKETEKEKDRVEQANENREKEEQYFQINWNDFEVVDTITFDEDKTEKEEVVEEKEVKEVEMESDSDQDDDRPKKKKIKISETYQPRVKAAEEREKTILLPDGQKIQAEAVNEHVRVDLMDPEARKQNEVYRKRQEQNPFHEKDISANLSNLAKQRPDVFGDSKGKQ
eukprot:augustus_masked-scaffold_56-processed-gene-1.87-mRNA-1 protein AED:1.00 eAED:1.00 QI:0/-1/0/0/-1/1/1/0/382